jgi:hypothetical protein
LPNAPSSSGGVVPPPPPTPPTLPGGGFFTTSLAEQEGSTSPPAARQLACKLPFTGLPLPWSPCPQGRAPASRHGSEASCFEPRTSILFLSFGSSVLIPAIGCGAGAAEPDQYCMCEISFAPDWVLHEIVPSALRVTQ